MVFRVIAGVIFGFVAAFLGTISIQIALLPYQRLKGVDELVFLLVWGVSIIISIKSQTGKKAWSSLIMIVALSIMLWPISWFFFSVIAISKVPVSTVIVGLGIWVSILIIICCPLSILLFFIGWLIGRDKKVSKDVRNHYYLG